MVDPESEKDYPAPVYNLVILWRLSYLPVRRDPHRDPRKSGVVCSSLDAEYCVENSDDGENCSGYKDTDIALRFRQTCRGFWEPVAMLNSQPDWMILVNIEIRSTAPSQLPLCKECLGAKSDNKVGLMRGSLVQMRTALLIVGSKFPTFLFWYMC